MSDTCPCCGRAIDRDAGLVWDYEARTLTGRGAAVTFARRPAKVFDVLWRHWHRGVTLSRMELTNMVYADDLDGGPESQNIISAFLVQMKPKLAPFELTVWRGRIVDLRKERARAA